MGGAQGTQRPRFFVPAIAESQEGGVGAGATGAPQSAAANAPHKERWSEVDPTKVVLYTGGFSFIQDALFYPVDIVVARLRVSVLEGSSSAAHNYSFPPYKNTLDGFRQLWKEGGLRAYYKGFWVSEIGHLPINIMFHYVAYEKLRDMLLTQYNASRLNPAGADVLCSLAAGSMADCLCTFLWVPSDVISVRLQTQGIQESAAGREKFRGGIDAARQIFKAEGVRGLWRGLGAAQVVGVPAGGIWWATYEISKKHLINVEKYLKGEEPTAAPAPATAASAHGHAGEGSSISHAIAGCLAGMMASTIVNPLSVAKTRLMSISAAEKRQLAVDLAVKKGRSPTQRLPQVTVFTMLKLTAQREGYRALSKGLWPTLITVIPHSSVSIVLYEQAMKLSRKVDQISQDYPSTPTT